MAGHTPSDEILDLELVMDIYTNRPSTNPDQGISELAISVSTLQKDIKRRRSWANQCLKNRGYTVVGVDGRPL